MSVTDYTSWRGRTVYGSDGNKIGKVADLFDDESGGAPLFATVHTGLFGTHTSFVPLGQAETRGDDLVVPYDKDKVKDAPRIDADNEISPAEEEQIFAYYGLQHRQTVGETGGYAGRRGTTDAGQGGYAGRRGEDAGQDAGYAGQDAGYAGQGGEYETRGPDSVATGGGRHERREDVGAPADTGVRGDAGTTGGRSDDAMTRSEERLNVGTEQVQTGRARLRKRIVTENVQQTVPVSHEEVRVEREPVTEGNRDAAYSGQELTESEHEVTLNAERPVVNKETVPVERVRLGTETVTDEARIDEPVSHEEIDTGDADRDRR